MEKSKKNGAPRRNARIDVRLPKESHAALERLSKLSGVSIGSVCKLAVAEGLMRHVQRTAAVPPATVKAGGPRFVNLGADEKPATGDHVAVYDHRTGLTWVAAPLQGGKDLNHADAMKACAAERLFGHTDWRAPTVDELLSIVDRERYDPATDPANFKGPFGWTWSSSLYRGASGFAWNVNLRNGDCLWNSQGNPSHVRAVRAGQPLGLSA